jgi:hypothetical protein
MSTQGSNPQIPEPVATYRVVAYLTGMTRHPITDDLPDYAQAVIIAMHVSELPGVREVSILLTVPGMVTNRLERVYMDGKGRAA